LAFFGSIAGKNIGVFTPEAAWAMVGITAALNFLTANFTNKILDFLLKFFH